MRDAGGSEAVAVLPAAAARSAPAAPPARLDAADLLARAVIVALFTALAIRVGANFLETLKITGLLLLASELLVVILTVARRAASTVDRRWKTRAFAAVSMAGPLLVIPGIGAGLAPEAVTATVSGCGLLIVIAGKVSLGRSFGLLPANRGIVRSGVYRLVRHPIYLGYLITHLAFLAAHPSRWNLVALLAGDVALLIRAVYEERTLRKDPSYADYMGQVRWRLVPKIF